MRRSLLWVIALSLLLIFLCLLAYLLKDPVLALDWSQFKISDVIALGVGLFGLFVAIVSLFVAVSQLQQAGKDAEEQKQALDTSRKQLEAVVESLKKQQEIQNLSLESTKSLVTLQGRAIESTKQLQEVLAQSLETSKTMLALQEGERKRVLELASRRPKLLLMLSGRETEIDKDKKVTAVIDVDKENRAVLALVLKNIGLAPLLKPVHIAIASPQEISIFFEGAQPDSKKRYHSQLSGLPVLDILPFSTSNNIYNIPINFVVPPAVSEFDLKYNLSGDNLDSPFQATIRVQLKRG